MMMMSSQGICKKREKRRKADTQPLTRVSWHPHHPPIIPDIVRYFLRVRRSFHNAILWNAPRTHNNQQIMPLIISGMSIHLWLALCPSSPAASNFPRRVRPAKKSENLWGFQPERGWSFPGKRVELCGNCGKNAFSGLRLAFTRNFGFKHGCDVVACRSLFGQNTI